MAVKSSGSLSLTTDIVGEFGGVAPHSLSEYYGGGTYVPAGANPSVATSGQTNMGSYYGAVAATVLTISSNTNNYDIGAAAIAAGGDKNTPVILTINAGVTVGSTSSSTPAMYTGTGWGAGVTINITNNGSIVGATGSNTSATSGNGGNGGRGGWYSSTGTGVTAGSAGSAGSGSAESANNGGNGFEHSQTADNYLSVIFDTAGSRLGGSAGTRTLYGGGGGGGGGGRGRWSGDNYQGGSGGGGQGATGGSRGSIYYYWCSAAYGVAGTSSSGGSGGVNVKAQAGDCAGHAGGDGGDGGSSGNSGQSGESTTGNDYAIGADAVGQVGGSGGSTAYASGSSGSALSGNTAQIS